MQSRSIRKQLRHQAKTPRAQAKQRKLARALNIRHLVWEASRFIGAIGSLEERPLAGPRSSRWRWRSSGLGLPLSKCRADQRAAGEGRFQAPSAASSEMGRIRLVSV